MPSLDFTPELKALHPLGAAPLIEGGELLLAESAAIVEYLVVKHGDGRNISPYAMAAAA